jgi:hypothetical protein
VDEHEWLTSTDSQAMLSFLRASDRKLRLFVAACARSLRPVFGDQQEVVAVMYERQADGEASEQDLLRVLAGELFDRLYPDGVIPPNHELQPVWQLARTAAKTATDFTHLDSRDHTDKEKARICNLLRDLFGPLPFRDARIDPAWLAWNDGIVKKLAQAAYEQRLFPEGVLDQARLALLADALEEADCADPELLAHLRSPGSHVRGCFALDAVLGKS